MEVEGLQIVGSSTPAPLKNPSRHLVMKVMVLVCRVVPLSIFSW